MDTSEVEKILDEQQRRRQRRNGEKHSGRFDGTLTKYASRKEAALCFAKEGRQTEADVEHRKYHKALNQRLSENVQKVTEYKLAKGCATCGYREFAEALEFDHLPQYKKNFNVARAARRILDWSVIEAEIAKCEVVCANCHRVRTAQRRFTCPALPDK
ncbi:MAG: hypothetical protein K2X38_13260 [Gemmataceae bacterium]|nr:hypothetical protein [Gemmataceae bacterium]